MWRHWFFLLLAVVRLVRVFMVAICRLRFRFMKDLKLPDATLLTKKELSRLQHYFLGASYLSAIFCCLRGRKLSSDEKYLFSNLSALASFFDDLVDSHPNKGVFQQNPPGDPFAFGLLADDRGLALYFLGNVFEKLPVHHEFTFRETMQRVFAIEIQGQHIESKLLDLNGLTTITAEKGGCSVLLFRCLLSPLPGSQEQAALREFGYLIQLSDDIFDVWFDHKDALETLATRCCQSGRVQDLMLLFEQQLDRTKHAFSEIQASKFRISTVLGILHGLSAITRCCLQHYRQLEKKHGRVPIQNREMVVVDMEKWVNRLSALKFLICTK